MDTTRTRTETHRPTALPAPLLGLAVALLIAVPGVRAAQIAVVDSGVNAVDELQGKVVTGYNFVDENTDTSDTSSVQHGTIVALIAIQTAGGGEILPVKVIGDVAGTQEDVNQGIQYAADRSKVRVINLSLGGPTTDAGEAAALVKAAQNGKVIVMAAGNSGAGQPEFPAQHAAGLSGTAIIVGAVDANNAIESYSNRAGGFKNYYMVASGTFGGFSDGSAAGRQGTSFAAPRVSGAAAAIIDRAPFLSATEVVEILLTTATDLGAPGVDEVYGHGLLNLSAALAPLGDLAAPTSGSASGGGVGVVAGAAVLGIAAYAILSRSQKAKKTLVLDQYQRPYYVDLTALASPRANRPGLDGLLRSLRFGASAWETGTRRLRLRLLSIAEREALVADRHDYFALRQALEDRRPDLALSLTGEAGPRLRYRLDLNQDPRRGYGPVGVQSAGALPGLLSERGFNAPYLGFADRGRRLQLSYQTGPRSEWRLGYAGMDEGGRFGLRSDALGVEGRWQVSRRARVGLQFGQLTERGSLFGSAADGVVAVDRAGTTALGIHGEYALGRTTLFGSYSEGLTRVRERRNSLAHDFTPLRSRTWGLGLKGEDLWRRGDRLTLALSRPLYVSRGEATLTIPQARDFPGNIYSEDERVSLKPTGRELDLEAAYQWRLRGGTELGAYFLYQREPFHLKDRAAATTIYGIMRRRF